MPTYKTVNHTVHRLIPSRFPPVLLFDWADSADELLHIAALEGLTNDRLLHELGSVSLVATEDWVGGQGSTPLMAAFTHPGVSRFTDGTYGVYYASDCLQTAVTETKFHRSQFLSASKEAPCLIQMREYTSRVKKQLVNMFEKDYSHFLDPDIATYARAQRFGADMKNKKEWGLYYPSVRREQGTCVAVLRAPALSIPVQGVHLEYIWDGEMICEVRQSLLHNYA